MIQENKEKNYFGDLFFKIETNFDIQKIKW